MKHLIHVVPIYQMLPEGLEIVRPPVAVVDVIRMLPDIASEDRLSAVHQRVFGIRELGNGQLAFLHSDPYPAGTELGHAGLNEIVLGLGYAAQVTFDLTLQLTGDLVAAATRLHAFPKMHVIIMLGSIVEETRIVSVGTPHDHFQRVALPLRPFEQFVTSIDVGFMMLVMMKFQR